MVMINGEGDLVGIQGTVDELCENVANLYATVIQHVIEEGEGSRSAYILTEVLTEALIRTVIELIDDKEGEEAILKACKTVGETGTMDKARYRVTNRSTAIS